MTNFLDPSPNTECLESETSNKGDKHFPYGVNDIADMMRLITVRSQEAASQERARIVSWAHKHPDMPLHLAVRFIEMGEHTK